MPHTGNRGYVFTDLHSVESYGVRGLVERCQEVWSIRTMFMSTFYQQDFNGAGQIILDV